MFILIFNSARIDAGTFLILMQGLPVFSVQRRGHKKPLPEASTSGGGPTILMPSGMWMHP
jgi:hypothetical protein